MKNPAISKAFDAFSRMKVLIVGDVMIDAYMWGKVDRISPEAPVPVVHIHKDENRPGGAANVAINIKTMGATPILCSVTGNDRHGAEFMRLLKENGMQESGIVLSDARQTTVKTRIIGNHHQLLRVDNETTRELNAQEEEALQQKIQTIISEQRPDVIILEDYDKGVFTEGLIRFITQQAKSANIPVTVDPKKKNFNTYRDVTLFKPNLSELKAGLKLDSITTDKDSLTKASQTFLQDRNIGIVMVTLSESGVFIADRNGSVIIPAHIRDIADVSGAGDTVISVASLCLAAGLPKEDIAALSNLAGGLVCESVGVVPIDREKLKAEAGRHM